MSININQPMDVLINVNKCVYNKGVFANLIFASVATVVASEILFDLATTLEIGVINLVVVELLLTRPWLINMFLWGRPPLPLMMRPTLALVVSSTQALLTPIFPTELIPILLLVSVTLIVVKLPPIIGFSPAWTFLLPVVARRFLLILLALLVFIKFGSSLKIKVVR
jgi:hypothetical protein